MSQVTTLEVEPASAVPVPPTRPARSLRRFQAMISAMLLVLLVLPFVFICLWARCDRLGQWEQSRLEAREARKGLIRMKVGNYFDAGDKMLLHDLPIADLSHGGVYVMGASSALYCLDDDGLPPDETRYIHNYGIYSMNHHQLVQFTQWLTDRWGLLQAGGDKNLLMIGLAYTNCVEPPTAATYLPYYFKRSGVYTYDYTTGISSVPMNPLFRFIHTEDARARSVVHRWMEDPELVAKQPYNVDVYRKACIKRLGPDWEPVMAREIVDLAKELDYLNAHHVNILAFRVPEGSWNDGIPSHDLYVKESDRVFAERGMKILDLSHTLPDSDFNDPVHLRASGTRKTEAKLLPIARDFLRSKGLLPMSQPAQPASVAQSN